MPQRGHGLRRLQAAHGLLRFFWVQAALVYQSLGRPAGPVAGQTTPSSRLTKGGSYRPDESGRP
jgi:hypothetical protein